MTWAWATGMIVPTWLLAHMTLTRYVVEYAGSFCQQGTTRTVAAAHPGHVSLNVPGEVLTVADHSAGSTSETTSRAALVERGGGVGTPASAVLSAPVPGGEDDLRSAGLRAPRPPASRDSSTRRRAARPEVCSEEACADLAHDLDHRLDRRRQHRVVAAWFRYDRVGSTDEV